MDVATNLGGALLSSIFSWLLAKLDSSEFSELLNSHKYVREEVPKWRNLLPKILAVLEDAEQKQVTNNLVKLFLVDLRDLAFDMEDVLDELELDARRKLIASSKASTSITHKLTPKWFKDREIASQIKKITARLQDFEGEISKLDLINLAVNGEGNSSKVAAERTLDSAMPESHNVYGRETDKEKIFQMFDNEGNNEGYSVIPIVGMGGLGKTTLAGLVYYDDEKLKEYEFELKAWVCVSDVFDVDRITKVILQKVTGKSYDVEDLFSLQEKLKKELSGKKFLFVLDDIWNEDYRSWDVLQRPFSYGAPGSKIIITTRNKDVAKTMRADDKVYNLDFLPEDECLSLFARHALGRENFDSHPELRGVGKEIVEKCRGLPLAVKVLGGLLRGKPHLHEWQYILNHDLCNLPEDKGGIFTVLKLSYNHLPSDLKRCFGYCAIFPTDYEFEKNELVLLWMAQGFLQKQSQGKDQRENHVHQFFTGHLYFDDLLSRSFFQPSNRDRSHFMMHDFVHDLALHVAGELCCSFEQILDYGKARHLSFFARRYDSLKRFDVLDKQRNLRTFLRLRDDGGQSIWFRLVSNEVMDGLLPKLKCLRVLSLGGYQVQKLPYSIGHLKHLRYINLSCSLIQSLPDSVGSLLFLQTLILSDCRQLSSLPATIGNLIDLHHLDISDTPSLAEIPLEICQLKSLVLLSKFILGKPNFGPRLKDLKNLPRLRGRLSISNLHNLLHIEDAKEANLDHMELDDLSLEWSSDFSESQNEMKEVLEWLKPHQGLQRLTVNCYSGVEFPSWIGDPSFCNLEFLELRDCKKCTSLPSLVQLPRLRELTIKGSRSAIKFRDEDNISSGDCFASLEKLKVEDCCMLIELPQRLPSLKELSIVECPQLRYSPVSLPLLETLIIHECSETVLRSMVDLTSLTSLYIYKISNLGFLPKMFLESITAVEGVRIESCEELTCLWEEGTNISNLARLKNLSISYCPLFASLKVEFNSLEGLSIIGCPSFKLFSSGKLPTTLQSLQISECENLESLPEGLITDDNISNNMLHLRRFYIQKFTSRSSFPGSLLPLDRMHNLNSLTYLSIEEVEGLESFPESGLSMPKLKDLYIEKCVNLKSLPKRMLELTSLRTLVVDDCQRIKSIPEDGLPPNLTRLCINCENLTQPMREWGLRRLTSLERFKIGWISPSGGDLLPTALTSLRIERVKDLKSLSRELLQNLNCLEELRISACPELQFIPIEVLPPSLGYLRILGCPQLERYLKKKRNYQRLVDRIAYVHIVHDVEQQ